MKNALAKVAAQRKKQNETRRIERSSFGQKNIINRFEKQYINIDNAIMRKKDTLLDFSHALFHKDARPVAFPLTDFCPIYLKQIRYRAIKTVNTNGNLLFALKPAVISGFNVNSSASPLLFTNNEAYDPQSSNNVLVGGNNWDNTYPSQGIQLPNDDFVIGHTVSTTICVTLTGVSNLEKKGKIYLAKQYNRSLYQGDPADDAAANVIVNGLSLPVIIKLKECKEIEIMNMGSESEMEYHYIPENGYSKVFSRAPEAQNINFGNHDRELEEFVCIVSGAAAGTQVQFNMYQTIQLRPKISKLDMYPSNYSTCVDNPDPLLAELQQADVSLVVTKRHNSVLSEKIAAISLVNTPYQNKSEISRLMSAYSKQL